MDVMADDWRCLMGLRWRVVVCFWVAVFAGNDVLAAPAAAVGPTGDTAPIDSAALDIHPTEVVQWQPQSALHYNNGYIRLRLHLKMQQDFTIYAYALNFIPPLHSSLVHLESPPTQSITDPLTGNMVDVYASGFFEVVILATEAFSFQSPSLQVSYVGCNERICLVPHTETLFFAALSVDEAYTPPPTFSPPSATPHSATKAAAASLHLPPSESASQSTLSVPRSPSLSTPPSSPSLGGGGSVTGDIAWDHLLARELQTEGITFLGILLICFLGGLLTNLTPCVYPLIPVTVKVLSGQSSKPYLGAWLFGIGIFLTYTILGVLASLSGGVMGSLVASKILHVVIGIIMLWMAFSMLGFGHFRFLQRWGQRFQLTRSSLTNALVMGCGAGFVASPCTGPVLASLMLYALSQHSIEGSIMLFGSYSLGFALPYMFFGPLIARLAKKPFAMPVQFVSKVFFAGCIFALALYYWRIPFYGELRHIDADMWNVVFLVLLAVGVVMTAAVLGMAALRKRKAMLIGPMMALGIAFFALSQSTLFSAQSRIFWTQGPEAIAQVMARSSQPKLIAMWAEWCVACKVMEKSTFADPEVFAFFERHDFQYIKYDVTEMDQRARDLLHRYGVKGLPAYVVIYPGSQASSRKVFHGYHEAPYFLSLLTEYVQDLSP